MLPEPILPAVIAPSPDVVRGHAYGQCGFDVLQPNPAAEAQQGPGVPEHIAVPSRAFPTYFGQHTATQVGSLPTVTTDAGNTITAVLNNFTLTGSGLTGSGTFSPSLGPSVSGDAVLTVTRPDHFGTFIAYDACNPCSLGGKSGTALLRFYGTVLPNGVTYGTFLITSGGAADFIPDVSPGALATLAGWGTFYGKPGSTTWSLVEHLKIT